MWFTTRVLPTHLKGSQAQNQGTVLLGRGLPSLPILCQSPLPPLGTHSCCYLRDQLQVIHIVLFCDNEFVDVSLSLSFSRGQHIQEM